MHPVADLSTVIAGRPVLVLGKGPSLTTASFAAHRNGMCVIGINQTVRSFQCDIAFFIDIEPLQESLAELIASDAAVILPWRPNRRGKVLSRFSGPMTENLDELCEKLLALGRFRDSGKLYYFHSRFKGARSAQNVFEPNLVSLSALLQILASLGVREVRTLGVDGGSGHSKYLKGSVFTQLRSGYDKQFPILRRIATTRGVSMSRADGTAIRIFVGCEQEQYLPARVLEFSIRKFTNEQVSIKYLYRTIDPSANGRSGRTPFSMQRFFIPELCSYQGRAIYLDSDMLVFANIRELLGSAKEGIAVASAEAPPGSSRLPQFSVMVLDCELARWKGDELALATQSEYESTMFELGFEMNKLACIPYVWNSLELYEPQRTKLLHYTDMDRQPWISNANRLAHVWVGVLNEAVRDGFISFDEVRASVTAGHVRPGLLWQIESGEADPLKMPRRERMRDELFTPPHTVARFSRHNGPLVRAGLAIARKALRTVRGR